MLFVSAENIGIDRVYNTFKIARAKRANTRQGFGSVNRVVLFFIFKHWQSRPFFVAAGVRTRRKCVRGAWRPLEVEGH